MADTFGGSRIFRYQKPSRSMSQLSERLESAGSHLEPAVTQTAVYGYVDLKSINKREQRVFAEPSRRRIIVADRDGTDETDEVHRFRGVVEDPQDLKNGVLDPIVSWVLNGYNCTLLTYGPRVDDLCTLVAADSCSSALGYVSGSDTSLLESICESLFVSESPANVYLSAFEIGANGSLRSIYGADDGHKVEIDSMHVSQVLRHVTYADEISFDDALKAVQVRSVSHLRHLIHTFAHPGTLTSHKFLRVVRSTDSKAAAFTVAMLNSSVDAANNTDLSALRKMVHDLADAPADHETEIYSRDTVLSTLLAPLIAGNVRLFAVVGVPSEESGLRTARTTLSVAEDLKQLRTICTLSSLSSSNPPTHGEPAASTESDPEIFSVGSEERVVECDGEMNVLEDPESPNRSAGHNDVSTVSIVSGEEEARSNVPSLWASPIPNRGGRESVKDQIRREIDKLVAMNKVRPERADVGKVSPMQETLFQELQELQESLHRSRVGVAAGDEPPANHSLRAKSPPLSAADISQSDIRSAPGSVVEESKPATSNVSFALPAHPPAAPVPASLELSTRFSELTRSIEHDTSIASSAADVNPREMLLLNASRSHAQSVGEAVRKTGDTDEWMRLVRKLEDERDVQRGQYEQLKRDVDEMLVQADVERENLRVEVVRLKSKLRQAQQSSGFGEIFEMYETEIARILAERATLEDELEKQIRKQNTSSSDNENGDSGGKSTVGSGAVRHRSKLHELQRQLQTAKTGNRRLQKQLEESQKHERALALYRRYLKHTMGRVKVLEKQARSQQRRHDESESSRSAIQSQLQRFEERNTQLESENAMLAQKLRQTEDQFDHTMQLLDELRLQERTDDALVRSGTLAAPSITPTKTGSTRRQLRKSISRLGQLRHPTIEKVFGACRKIQTALEKVPNRSIGQQVQQIQEFVEDIDKEIGELRAREVELVELVTAYRDGRPNGRETSKKSLLSSLTRSAFDGT